MATSKRTAAASLTATPRRKSPAKPATATSAPAKPVLARMPPAPPQRTPPTAGALAPPSSDDDARSSRLGHYGWRAMALLLLGLVVLIVHLAVPYQVIFCDGAQCPDDKSTSREDVSDSADLFDDAWVSSAGPGLTLAGAIILLVGGLLLAVLGFMAMPTNAARWAGWLSGAVALLGAWFAASSSFYWIGGWVVALMNLGNAGGPDFILLLSPLIVGAAAVAAVLLALGMMRDVITTRDGLRDAAGESLVVAKWALLSLGLVLLVPWSFNNPPGEAYEWHGALGIQLTHGFSSSSGFGGGGGLAEQWTGMNYALTVLVVTTWVTAFVAVLVSAGGLLADTLMPPRWLPLAHGASLFLLGWSAVLYVLAWVYMWKPSDGADDFMPGFFPVLVLAGLVPLALKVLKQFRGGLATVSAGSPATSRPVRFD